MALRSYKKDGYTYTESAPGSNKFQNFTAAKPTVKDVRVESAKKKAAAVVPPKAKGKPGESKMARDEATRKTSRMGGMDTGNVMKSRPSATPDSDYREPRVRGTPPRANRQGGMDTGNVMRKSYPSREMDPTPVKVRKARPDNAYLRDKEFGRMSVTEATRKPSKYKESFMSRTRRKGILGALFGN